MTTTTTTTTTGPHTTVHTSHTGPSGPRAAPQSQVQSQPQRQGYANATAASIRPVNPSDVQSAYTSSSAQTQPGSQYTAVSLNMQGKYASSESPITTAESTSRYSVNDYGKQSRQPGFDGAKSASIPRKEVGAGSARNSTEQSAQPHIGNGHTRNTSGDKSSSSARNRSHNGDASRRIEPVPAPAASSVFDNNKPISRRQPALDAQAVADRAKTSTKDTSVVEKYAPGQLTDSSNNY